MIPTAWQAQAALSRACSLDQDPSHGHPLDSSRPGRPQSTGAGLQSGAGGGDVVHQENRLTAERRPSPGEGVCHVGVTSEAVEAHLRRRVAETDQPTRRAGDLKAAPELSREQLRLVVAPPAQPCLMKRDRQQKAGGETIQRHPLHHQSSQRGREAAPALVLEAVDRPFQRPFVCRRSPSSSERPKTLATTAAGGGKLQLASAARTERLLEAANQRQAGVAEPVPQAPATAAPAR
jgi:hypothetical protein